MVAPASGCGTVSHGTSESRWCSSVKGSVDNVSNENSRDHSHWLPFSSTVTPRTRKHCRTFHGLPCSPTACPETQETKNIVGLVGTSDDCASRHILHKDVILSSI